MAPQPRVVVKDVRRVVLLGPESTGKTVLAARLAEHYHTTRAPEYLRTYVERRRARPHRTAIARGEMRDIAAGQVAVEDRAARRARRVVFFDTNPLQSIVYYEHYFQHRAPAWLERLLQGRHYDLYLLLDVDAPWIPDEPRDRPHFRRGMHRLFTEALRSRDLPFVRVFGTWAQRYERAIRAVDGLLGPR